MEKFLSLFAEQFDETEASEIQIDTTFRDLDEWDSMTALSVMAMFSDEYNVSLSGDQIRNANTVKDLYELTLKKAQ